MIILSELKLPALPYVAPITAISDCQNVNYVLHTKSTNGLVGSNLSLLKVYEGLLGYAEESSLTLHDQFIQLYKVLDTTFSKYY